jgi:hypothetical protein
MNPFYALSHFLLPSKLVRLPYNDSYNDMEIKLIEKWLNIISSYKDGNINRNSQLYNMNNKDIILTKGVRDGIYLSLHNLKDIIDEIIWPMDVYPVYERIIDKSINNNVKKSRIITITSSKIKDIDFNILKSSSMNSVLLLPVPITPIGIYISIPIAILSHTYNSICICIYISIGRALTTTEIDLLTSWLNKSTNRRIILDCVYSYDLLNDMININSLVNHPRVITLHSLSKGYLSPFLEPTYGPICNNNDNNDNNNNNLKSIIPKPRELFSRGIGFLHSTDNNFLSKLKETLFIFDMSCSLTSIYKAMNILNNQPFLPLAIQHRFQKQWNYLSPKIQLINPDFIKPKTGYFSVLPDTNYINCLQENSTLLVPATVFESSSRDNSIVTCLYDIKRIDNECNNIDYGQTFNSSNINENNNTQTLPLSANNVEVYHVTTLSNFMKCYDKYSRKYDKSHIIESTFPTQFFLLHANQIQTGIDKACKLLNKLNLKDDCLLVLHTKVNSNSFTPHPKGQYINQNWINVTDLSILKENSEIEKINIESAMALSIQVNQCKLMKYNELKPRSISILPIAKGCQAKCSFCFSKGSVSNDTRQKPLPDDRVENVLKIAKNNGAERAVITGGGEPFMLPFNRLINLIKQCSIFSNVCIITNGYYLTQQNEENRMNTLKELDKAGLTVLSLSRHGATDTVNESIMMLKIPSSEVAKTWRYGLDNGYFTNLTRMRWVCVLQKGAVDSNTTLIEYFNMAASSGVSEICFKELYISTSTESLFHDASSNKWSEENQVPLSLIIDFCNDNNFKQSGSLPWKAPIYEGVWNGQPLKIAAYTEPSVYWERVNGVCRSWNLMSDSTCLASLEDRDSGVCQ